MYSGLVWSGISYKYSYKFHCSPIKDNCDIAEKRLSNVNDADADDFVVGRPTQLIFISDIHLLGWRW